MYQIKLDTMNLFTKQTTHKFYNTYIAIRPEDVKVWSGDKVCTLKESWIQRKDFYIQVENMAFSAVSSLPFHCLV